MIESILELDKQAFLWLNSYHNVWLDQVMLFMSKSKVWIPFYLLLIYFIFKKHQWQTALKYIVIILVSVGLSDFVASGIFKPYFHRLRPCHDILSQMILVGNCGGKYGFVSSHAANTFALFFGILKIFGKSSKWSFLLLFWAILVSFSRIYIGVHYPIDVIMGALLGILISYLIFGLNKRITK